MFSGGGIRSRDFSYVCFGQTGDPGGNCVPVIRCSVPGGGGKICVFYRCGHKRNAAMAADYLYAGNRGCCDCTFRAVVWLVSCRYVAALGHVCGLFWVVFSGKLFCDGMEGENGE